ncbi:hypothetical protein H2248_012391 [Termitomyces sp. 'cryptogamus']|nr:hypothetical protein H2248_012391 [Termitomyces sp. 'cryptogamus']
MKDWTKGWRNSLRGSSSLIDLCSLKSLLPTQPEAIADLARTVSIPIALGERLYTRFDFRLYLEKGAIDIAGPDVAHCGAISELHRIGTLTETYDVALAPHCPQRVNRQPYLNIDPSE